MTFEADSALSDILSAPACTPFPPFTCLVWPKFTLGPGVSLPSAQGVNKISRGPAFLQGNTTPATHCATQSRFPAFASKLAQDIKTQFEEQGTPLLRLLARKWSVSHIRCRSRSQQHPPPPKTKETVKRRNRWNPVLPNTHTVTLANRKLD